jgi:hypothetical protein
MPKNLVKTPYKPSDLQAPENTEASNIGDVLQYLRETYEYQVEWLPRAVRKGARPPADADCLDLKFGTAADAVRFSFRWCGEMRAGERRL